MSWFEFWSNRLQQAEHLMKTQLTPPQRNQLHGNHEVRLELQNQRMTSLLPPVGVEVFRRFMPASLEEIQQEAEKNKKPEKDQSKPASHLQAGKPLPFIYGDPPPELLSTPLEDLDPFYQSQKTFTVICKKKLIHRFNADPACYLLSPFNCLRSSAIKILLHPVFSLFFILTIVTNCVFMTMPHMLWTINVEYVFMIIYTGEVILKLLSRGVCFGRFTFLRDPWNWLDVLNITASVIALSVGLREFAALKTISRVLKLFSYLPGLKKTAERLVQSLKWLAVATVLTVFVLSVLALLGMQFFMGVLKHKCVNSSPSGMMDTPTTEQPEYFLTNKTINFYDNFVFEDYIDNVENLYFMPGQSDHMLCGNSSDSRRCPMGFTCIKTGRNPEYGFTSFDTFGWSLLAVVRIAMQDRLDVLLQLTLQAAGKANISVFVLIFFPGCFLVVSLSVAAVAIALVKQEKAEAAEAKKTEEEFSWIVKVLTKRVDNEVTGETKLLGGHNSPQKKKPAARTLDQENITVEDTKDEVQPSCCSCADRILQGECCICSQWLKLKLRPFVLSQFFDLGIIVCIIINTVFMAVEHHRMTMDFQWKLANLHLVFTAIFTAELLLKVLALGIKGYFKVSWHIFDFIIVIHSLLDFFLSGIEGLSLFSVALLRPLRLGRWWSALHLLMKITWFSVGNLSVVLVFVAFMFAVVGTQLFQQNYQENVCMLSSRCELPRWHMMDFSHTFLLVFRVLSGEWIECMWDCMKISNKGLCVIYYMAVVLIGNLLVVNLFLYLLLSPSCANKPGAAAGQGPNKRHAGSWILESFRALTGRRTYADTDQKVESKNKDRQHYLALTPVSNDSVKDSSVVELSGSPGNEFKIQADTNKEEKKQKIGDVQKLQDNENQTENSPGDCCCAICYSCCPIQDIDTSKGAGRGWYKFRKACLLIVQHRLFEIFIIFIILLSSAALALEDTLLFHRPVLQMVLDKADQVFTFLFLMEMLLKWTAFGFRKYFSSFWCWLDFLILDVSLFSSVGVMLGYSAAYLRTLRALRTLRVPSRFKGMRVVLRDMAAIAPSMCNSLLVVVFVWLIFSILGVNMFAGKFAYCSNHTDDVIFEVDNRTQCYELNDNSSTGIFWKYNDFNFDHVGMGLLSLLIMATSTGWTEIIYAAVDSTKVDIQPEYESKPVMYLYFVLFIVFGCFFSANLFIRFFVDALHQLSNKAGGKHVFMTEEQLKFHGTIRKMFPKSPEKAAPRPTNRFQARLFDLMTAPLFEILVVALISVNAVVMMMDSDDLSEQGQEVLMWFLFVFIILYCIEFFLKITALRRHYFNFGLNILDFVVLIFMILGLFFSELLEKYFVSPAAFFILRLARISRVLPFFRLGRRIQMLLTGFMMSLPALMNIGFLFLLVVYTYSFVGMRIFYMINFGTIGDSMISMILFSPSSAWSLLVWNSTKYSPPTIVPLWYWANLSAGVVFFCSYVLLHLLLVVHLFIAVILESFNSREAEDAVLLQMFYNTWREFDPEALQVIRYSELSDFCDALQDPLRIPKPNNIRLINMDLPLLPGDQICCLDVLKALMTQTYGEEREMDSLKAQLEKKFTGNNTTKVSHEPISSTLQRKQEDVAAAVIQRAFRKHQVRNRPDGADGAPDQPEDEATGMLVSSQ
ncbi:sodium channel protein type 4 subunit alpha-like isoform X2 [Poecilia reticulata]|uniref:sodium channel protein type 4 subunit alpha-like isoform X2 n=1 Tax=Poecilia reticulata TaxID=8081 RepID=UPI0004A448FC|nr:PREDICTED: sodium channel protein type 4 subunit alpha-like isoform X2 [Poecilia reticulata]